MNEFNKHYIKLEIPIILEKLKNLAFTLSVKDKIDHLEPSSDIDYLDSEFRNIIYPGQDNATAIVYTKKKIKNN